jgi:hypothetical protein
MTVTRMIAAAALLAGLAVGTASTAWTAPTMSGHYMATTTSPGVAGQATQDWHITPCGDGCASVRAGTTAQTAQAHLVNGQWAMDVLGGGATCSDGSQAPLGSTSIHYTWDPNTLAGTVQITVNAPTCGQPVGPGGAGKIQLKQAP